MRRVKRILHVDDDADALRVAGLILRRAGFEVTLAASGEEALGFLDAGEPFDALVTDYTMPGLSGLTLVELALERDPGLPTLVVTGYARDAELDQLPSHVPVLTKPFTRIEFIHHIELLVRSRRVQEAASPV